MTLDAPLRFAIQQLALGASLDREATAAAFGVVMRGEASAVQTAALLMGLRAKGETADEMAGAVLALRCAMVTLETVDSDFWSTPAEPAAGGLAPSKYPPRPRSSWPVPGFP